jgi:hypothetical protein
MPLTAGGVRPGRRPRQVPGLPLVTVPIAERNRHASSRTLCAGRLDAGRQTGFLAAVLGPMLMIHPGTPKEA